MFWILFIERCLMNEWNLFDKMTTNKDNSGIVDPSGETIGIFIFYHLWGDLMDNLSFDCLLFKYKSNLLSASYYFILNQLT